MQSLWAGQGQLMRLKLEGLDGTTTQSVVVKHIVYASSDSHPRGWNSQGSAQRKRHSYAVELHWYRDYVASLNASVKMPELRYFEESAQSIVLVLEDLAVDFPVRFTLGKDDRPSPVQIESCIGWLAKLHARTLECRAEGLWPIGGYWHLDTRPDEWLAMPESTLKNSAKQLDQTLRNCGYQCLMHGDAKLANFCFDDKGQSVAAVDFQYVGRGVGVQDLMLLLSSVLPDAQLLAQGSKWVDVYFEQLTAALLQWQPNIKPDEVIKQWRALYPITWADFHRFLAGWSPDHWKIGKYCIQQTEQALRMCHSDQHVS
ncbi:ecdysteroid 22-kinase family protein [Echinimonas agarilytica]|uniref:Ecdysteroid 22-kinase family protein n=1 Tax=Echinimonas agarilytica TaxID=1215918 RepID=A0AA41W7L4_9GAMM|nr:ecdysteroid 22-kinase family protein [Echinimonas agarilytica]MCM2680670.1 ecdysteroid 22-kinase family protein [Echinimonas agarilytica]